MLKSFEKFIKTSLYGIQLKGYCKQNLVINEVFYCNCFLQSPKLNIHSVRLKFLINEGHIYETMYQLSFVEEEEKKRNLFKINIFSLHFFF